MLMVYLNLSQYVSPPLGLLGRLDPAGLEHVLSDIQTDGGDLHVEGSLM